MNIGILGAGAYAIALADILIHNNNKVTLWSKFKEEIDHLNKYRNNKNFSNYTIPNEAVFTNDLNVVMNNDLIIFAVPADFIDDTALEIKHLVSNQYFCIASKGLYKDKILFEIINSIINTNNIGVISGPTFAIDIINKVPIGLTVASLNNETNNIISKALKSDRVAIDINNDIIGVSICGSIKNIGAIANGIINGLNLPISTQALVITKLIEEIKNIIKIYGGDENTISSLAGIGDLILTCTSNKSRNFTLGYMLGSNQDKSEINSYIQNTTIEGLAALKQIEKLIINHKNKLPIICCIYNILYNKGEIKELINIITK